MNSPRNGNFPLINPSLWNSLWQKSPVDTTTGQSNSSSCMHIRIKIKSIAHSLAVMHNKACQRTCFSSTRMHARLILHSVWLASLMMSSHKRHFQQSFFLLLCVLDLQYYCLWKKSVKLSMFENIFIVVLIKLGVLHVSWNMQKAVYSGAPVLTKQKACLEIEIISQWQESHLIQVCEIFLALGLQLR